MTDFASANLAQVRWIEEADFGVTPVTGNSNNLRITGESLAFSISKTESGEITPDRMTTDLIETSASATGGVNIELSYREFDTLLRAVLMTPDWVHYGVQTAGVGQGVGTSFGATFTTTTISADVNPSGTSAFTGLQKGQWIQVQSPLSVNDKKSVKISTTVSPSAGLVTLDAATPLVAEGPFPCKLSSSRASNGTTKKSFTLERAHNDVGQFFQFRGMTPSKLSLSMASGSILTGSIEFIGKDGGRTQVTSMPGTPVDSTAYDVMNAVSGVGNIMENGALLSGTKIKKLDISIDNSLRGQDAIGERGNAGIGLGTLKVTGSMEVYLANGTLYDKFLNNTRTSLEVIASDKSKNGYAVIIAAMKYGDAKVNAGSKDSECMISLPFTGIKDTVTGKVIILDRMGV
jgi:hypothetical protein